MKTVIVKDGITKGITMPSDGGIIATGGKKTVWNRNWRGALPPIPSTGPGPQELIGGDMDAGYFGEVTAEELFSGVELGALVSFGVNLTNSTAGWLKFAYQEKILFVAKRNFRKAIGWEDIYAAGLVYGTDDFGINPTGTPTNQLKIVTKGEDSFKVRLLRGANSEPASTSEHNTSEWDVLMYKVHVSVPASQDGENWAEFDSMALGVHGSLDGENTHCQETWDFDSNNRITRGGGDFGDGEAAITKITSPPLGTGTNPYGWRPVLELIQE